MNPFSPFTKITSAIPRLPLYRLRQRIDRWRRAWRYATGTWTKDDAGSIAHEAHAVAGYAVLETFDVEGVVALAEDYFGPHPRLEGWARRAVRRVGDKWSSTGDAADVAQDWAIDLIGEYAEADGVDLAKTEAGR